MSIIAWSVLELAAGLLAYMLIPGLKQRGLWHLVSGQSGRSRTTVWFAQR
jgi:hypothetical protein